MKCPHCGYDDDRVLDSRPVQDGEAVRRRRECVECNNRFTTYEYVERMPMMVVKRDGRREPYDRQKLLSGIMLSLRKRPIGPARAEEIVREVETGLAHADRIEVGSCELGDMVLNRLVKLDPVAYVRFASVYRQFENPQQFMSELENLSKGGNGAG